MFPDQSLGLERACIYRGHADYRRGMFSRCDGLATNGRTLRAEGQLVQAGEIVTPIRKKGWVHQVSPSHIHRFDALAVIMRLPEFWAWFR